MAHGKEASTSGNAKKCLPVIRLGSNCPVDSIFLLGGEFAGATTESSNLKLGKAKLSLDGRTVLDWRQKRGQTGKESGLNGVLNGV